MQIRQEVLIFEVLCAPWIEMAPPRGMNSENDVETNMKGLKFSTDFCVTYY